MHKVGLCTAGRPGLPRDPPGIAETHFGEPRPPCPADLRRVALFSVAFHPLHLLHVQHFRLRSCEPSATQTMSVRLATKLQTNRQNHKAFLKHYTGVWPKTLSTLQVSKHQPSVISTQHLLTTDYMQSTVLHTEVS